MEKEKFQTFKKRFFNFKILNKLLFASFVILGIYYLVLANNLSVKGFALSDLKLERNKLSETNNKLELAAMALSSYGNISRRISDLKMVAVGSIDYISGGSGQVAKK